MALILFLALTIWPMIRARLPFTWEGHLWYGFYLALATLPAVKSGAKGSWKEAGVYSLTVFCFSGMLEMGRQFLHYVNPQ